MFWDPDTDDTKTSSELSQSSCEESLLYLYTDDLLITKVRTVGSNFTEKICSGTDNDGDFEIIFLEQSRKITNRFIFPYN